jgi:hypothetical protein
MIGFGQINSNFQLFLGGSYSSINKESVVKAYEEEFKGVSFGLTFLEFEMTNKLSIKIQLMKQDKGDYINKLVNINNVGEKEVTISNNLNYLTIPFIIQRNWHTLKWKFSINGGVYTGWILDATQNTEVESFSEGALLIGDNEYQIGEQDIKEEINTTDFGFGFGYEISRKLTDNLYLGFSASVEQGLVDIDLFDSSKSTNISYNSSLFLSYSLKN